MPKSGLSYTRARGTRGVMAAASTGLSLLLIVTLAASACTDNGDDTSHGPNIGEIPKIDGGSSGDGAVVPPDPDGSSNLDGSPTNDADPFQDASAPCTSGVAAVLVGSDTTLSGAIKDKEADWVAQVITGGAAKSKPAIVQFGAGGGGFLGVTHGPGDVLQTVSVTGTTWTAATTIGGAGVKGSPALGVVGTKAHVVYSAGPNANRDFTHGIHDGANWNAATAAVGAPPSFGTVSAGVVGAAGATELVFAENGTNNGLYVRTFDTAWSTSTAIVGAGTVGASPPATPELLSIEGAAVGGGGQLDLLLIFVQDSTRRLSFATRETSSKTWSMAAGRGGVIHADANTAEKLSVSRSGSNGVVVAFRGQDGKGYYTQGTIAAQSIAWTAASPVGGVAVAIDSTPAIAKGVCGDDAMAAYATAGIIYATRLRGTTWKAPEVISGLGGSRVAITTSP